MLSVLPGEAAQTGGLIVVETHPVQYHVPVYREFAALTGEATTVIYGSDFSVTGGYDREFGQRFAWDIDLLSGYRSIFLGHAADAASAGKQFPLRRLCGILGKMMPSALLLPGYADRLYQAAYMAAVLTRTPLLFRGETTDHAVSRSTGKLWLRRMLLRIWYERCERLLYIGERSRLHFERLGCDPAKLEFSPYCVDGAHLNAGEDARQRLRGRTREELGIAPDAFVLLFSGKLSRRKRPDLLVRAAPVFGNRANANVAVVLLGDGEMRPEIEAMRMADGSVPVIVTGFKNQSELSPFYHAADALVLPSASSETWGLVINEALQHGLPCVVSDAVGCAPDLVAAGVTGEVFTSGSEESLVAALMRAQALLNRREVRDRCRARVSKYTTARAAEGLAAAYRTMTRA